jgi:hypothetical protein
VKIGQIEEVGGRFEFRDKAHRWFPLAVVLCGGEALVIPTRSRVDSMRVLYHAGLECW